LDHLPNSSYDYLIVGQGLAGSLLAHLLQKKNQKVLLIDNAHHHAATKIASGLINPMTGRRLVKTWMFEDLMAFAKLCYGELGALFQQDFYVPKPILKSLFNIPDETEWLIKSGDPLYEDFMIDREEMGRYEEKINPVFGVGELLQTAQVNVSGLIECFREHFVKLGCLQEELFDFEAISFHESGKINYKEYELKKIVFCEGYQAVFNPYFQYLPFELAKGEVLLVKIPNVNFDEILKHKVFIVPYKEKDVYWIGSTYEREFEDESPTDIAYQHLAKALKEILKVPFEILDHKAAVRPTVMDRRPLLGTHVDYPQLSIFNGLGAKGASLGPYWANEMTEFLIYGKPLHPEVDIQRFYPWHKTVFPL